MSQNPLWKGTRGEWYLVVQGCLFLLVAFGPRNYNGLTAWVSPYTRIASLSGGVLMASGILLAATASFNLGKNLTPFPYPKDNSTLIVTGAYRLVRHPIYSGLTFMALGWGLWLQSWLTIGYALTLLLFFDIKSRREERFLVKKFPEYTSYREQVRKLIPFIY